MIKKNKNTLFLKMLKINLLKDDSGTEDDSDTDDEYVMEDEYYTDDYKSRI